MYDLPTPGLTSNKYRPLLGPELLPLRHSLANRNTLQFDELLPQLRLNRTLPCTTVQPLPTPAYLAPVVDYRNFQITYLEQEDAYQIRDLPFTRYNAALNDPYREYVKCWLAEVKDMSKPESESIKLF